MPQRRLDGVAFDCEMWEVQPKIVTKWSYLTEEIRQEAWQAARKRGTHAICFYEEEVVKRIQAKYEEHHGE